MGLSRHALDAITFQAMKIADIGVEQCHQTVEVAARILVAMIAKYDGPLGEVEMRKLATIAAKGANVLVQETV